MCCLLPQEKGDKYTHLTQHQIRGQSRRFVYVYQWTATSVDKSFQRDLGAIQLPFVHMKFKGNRYGPIPGCLVFTENPYGSTA